MLPRSRARFTKGFQHPPHPHQPFLPATRGLRTKTFLKHLLEQQQLLSAIVGDHAAGGAPEQESPAPLPTDVCETAAREPTFPSQPQTVIHVLPAGQSQLPTEHHMICSDIRSAPDSPSASPFHACGLHHSTPCRRLAGKQVVESRELLFSYKIFFGGLVPSVSNRREGEAA